MVRHFLVINLIMLVCGSSMFASAQITRTPLPTLTPTPQFYRWRAAAVVEAIRQAGLETQNARVMKPDEYGPIPALAAQGVYFSVPSACPACGGIVLAFNTSQDLETTKLFFTQTRADDNSAVSSWVFERDNVLLQLSGQMSEAQARQYGAVLIRLQ